MRGDSVITPPPTADTPVFVPKMLTQLVRPHFELTSQAGKRVVGGGELSERHLAATKGRLGWCPVIGMDSQKPTTIF